MLNIPCPGRLRVIPCCIFCLLSGLPGSSQQLRTIAGTVQYAGGYPLAGVTVQVKHATLLTATDGDGRFSIRAGAGDTLLFSRLGYGGQEIAVGSDTSFRIMLAATGADLIPARLRGEAALDFRLRQLPGTKKAWELHRENLVRQLMRSSGAVLNHSLPLDLRETGHIRMKGYTIRKIYFQTRPSVYATADLYVPDGQGPFPAVINLHGHWGKGKASEVAQSCAHELALNGYVCLSIDAWGAGERTTVHGTDEYHGSNLGASLLNIGESLLGNQLSDNIRGVDLLCSLPYVDRDRIGATGASGGGNQTMWLSAMDERIRAAMPVVSVGTFQAYVMASNCICELMPDVLTCTEESGILALMAPRAVKICSGLKENNSAFYPAEMLRSFSHARKIFSLYGVEDHIDYQLFNLEHGYWPEMRQAMIAWFDRQLKGMPDQAPKAEIPFDLLTEEQLMVFPEGKRDPLVTNTSDYCIHRGQLLTNRLYTQTRMDQAGKRRSLHELLHLPGHPDSIETIRVYDEENGWQRMDILTRNRHLIPLRYLPAGRKQAPLVIFCHPDGPEAIRPLLDAYRQKGYGILWADVWGTGENHSAEGEVMDGGRPQFHTIARAELLLGHTVLGEWVSDIRLLIGYAGSQIGPSSLTVDAGREIAVAALMQSALDNNADTCVLRTCPVSYALDRREGIDFFNLALHLPGILTWGDISLVAALNKKAALVFEQPVSVTGRPVTGEALSGYKGLFDKMNKACNNTHSVLFRE
jgi:hypothetical protein